MKLTKPPVPWRDYAWFVEPSAEERDAGTLTHSLEKLRALHAIVQLEAARLSGATFAGLAVIDDDPHLASDPLTIIADYPDLAPYQPVVVAPHTVITLQSDTETSELLARLGLTPGSESAGSTLRFSTDAVEPGRIINALFAGQRHRLVFATVSAASNTPMPAVNTVMDLSSATGPAYEGLRADALAQQDSVVPVHFWTITALYDAMVTDARVLEAKHATVWGLTREGDSHLVRGLDHVLDYRQRKHMAEVGQGVAATSLSEINTSTLNALQDRATTARIWRNYTPLPDVTPQLLIEEPQEIRGVKRNQSVNFAVTVLFVILAALVVRFAALLSYEGLTTGNMLGAGIPLIIIVVNYRIISDIVQTVRTSASPTAPFVAMFRALEENAGNLGRAFALPFTHQLRIHSITWVKGESEKIEVTISDRETADCSQILATMNEVLAPPSPSTRWVLEAGRADFTVGRSLVWLATLFFSRSAPQYFAVPDALTRPEEAEQFAQSWRELVGPCRLKEAPEVLTGSAPLAARLRELA